MRVLIFLLLLVTAAQAGPKVIVYGDSRSTNPPSIAGAGTWTQYLTGQVYVAYARGGMTCEGLVKDYVYDPSNAEKATVTAIRCGVNDLLDGATAEHVYAAMTQLREYAKKNDSPPVVFTETCGTSLSAAQERECARLNELIRADAVNWHLVIPIDEVFPDHDDRRAYVDGVHETPEFARIIYLMFRNRVAAKQ